MIVFNENIKYARIKYMSYRFLSFYHGSTIVIQVKEEYLLIHIVFLYLTKSHNG